MKIKHVRNLVIGAIAGVVISTGVAAPAQAGSNHGQVINMAGASVYLDCSLATHGHADHTLYEKSSGKKFDSEDFCSDADAFKPRYDKRCIELLLPVSAYWIKLKADPGHWSKLPGYSTAIIKPYKGCSHQPWVSSYLKRVD